MSEYERTDRMEREPTVEDMRQLMGASTPHFALQIRNRIRNLIAGLPAGPSGARRGRARDRAARAARGRGRAPRAGRPGERELPSIRARLT